MSAGAAFRASEMEKMPFIQPDSRLPSIHPPDGIPGRGVLTAPSPALALAPRRQRELRDVFSKVYGKSTSSCNNGEQAKETGGNQRRGRAGLAPAAGSPCPVAVPLATRSLLARPPSSERSTPHPRRSRLEPAASLPLPCCSLAARQAAPG